MIWFKDEIINGLQALVAIRLRGAPSAETLPTVAKVWMTALASRPVEWNEDLDTARIRAAFVEIAATAKHWPSPAEFLALLPARKPQVALPPPSDGSMSPVTRKLVDDLMKKMRVNH